jgi:D-arabinose 1-dehydrogenase-like Zn-dependent alcohol dehydrogenase
VIATIGHEDTVRQADRLLRPGGRVVAVGYSPGAGFSLPSPRFVLEKIQLMGSRHVRHDELERAIALVSEGGVEMIVERVKLLEEVNEACNAVQAEDVDLVGWVVLDVGGVS